MRTSRAHGGLAAILLLTVLLAACGSGSSSNGAKASDGNGYGGGSTTTAAAAAGGSAISIKGFAFSPASLKVAVGTTVKVTNGDSPTHTWTADDKAEWDSGDLAPGRSYEHTFDKAGTYAYHCNIHSSMKGTVVVS